MCYLEYPLVRSRFSLFSQYIKYKDKRENVWSSPLTETSIDAAKGNLILSSDKDQQHVFNYTTIMDGPWMVMKRYNIFPTGTASYVYMYARPSHWSLRSWR